jgi:hypothetical protein
MLAGDGHGQSKEAACDAQEKLETRQGGRQESGKAHQPEKRKSMVWQAGTRTLKPIAKKKRPPKLTAKVAQKKRLLLKTRSSTWSMSRDVSLHMALAIADTAIAEYEKTGNDVSVAVVDRAGRLRVFLQGDKAAPHNIELAQRKAYTARTFGRTSAEWAERTGPNSELAGQR